MTGDEFAYPVDNESACIQRRVVCLVHEILLDQIRRRLTQCSPHHIPARACDEEREKDMDKAIPLRLLHATLFGNDNEDWNDS